MFFFLKDVDSFIGTSGSYMGIRVLELRSSEGHLVQPPTLSFSMASTELHLICAAGQSDPKVTVLGMKSL